MQLALFSLALLFPWAFAWEESRKDAKRADRWNHVMKEVFHQKYGFLRGWLLLLVAFLCYQPDPCQVLTAGIYQICAFGYGFTYLLNKARHKHPFYQSREERAAWVDRSFVWLGKKIGVTPEQLAGIVYTFLLAISATIFLRLPLGW
ncbi:hypothetical protein [Amycolatopsis magusensis]